MSTSSGPSLAEAGPEPGRAALWRFGEFELDERVRELRRGGQPVDVEPKPLNLLLLMVRHPGVLLTRNDLIETLWTGRIVTDAVLANCVAKLRQVLGDTAQTLVRTVHGYGYRFEASPQRVDNAAPVVPPRLQLQPGQTPPLRPNWRLVRRLGKTGEAWLAEHDKTQQKRVFKFTDSPEGLTALKREVTIHRLLRASFGDGLAVAGLLEWNFDEPPWFVETEYCPGGSLQEWCELHGGVSTLPLGQCLSIVIQIAETLESVHQVGVLHKDLKPANVLIVPGAGGSVSTRLSDFGSGQLTDLGQLEALTITRLGFTRVQGQDDSASGTPLYLAPEVLSGQPPTVKSDIYALGVLLYQLVTGNLRQPMAPGWEREISDDLLREDIAYAAYGDPALRMASAAELAGRLQRLDERRSQRAQAMADQAEALAAIRDLAQLRARRSRLMLVVGMLSVGLALSGALYWQARQARQVAEAETRRAQAVADFLTTDMLAQINAHDRDVKDIKVKTLLDNAKAAVESRFAGEPELAARVYEAIGRSYLAIEDLPDAQKTLDAALELREAKIDAATLSLAEELVKLHYKANDLPAQLARFENLADRGAATLGAASGPVLNMRLALAQSYGLLGQWQRAAEGLRAMRAMPSVASDGDMSLRISRALSYVDNDLADYAEAEDLLQQQIAGLQSLPMNWARADAESLARMRLGRTYTKLGRYAAAEAQLNSALELLRSWDTDFSGSVFTHQLYLAELRNEQGRFAEAGEIAQRQLLELQALNDEGMDQSFTFRRILAESYHRLGHLNEAESEIRKTLAILARALPAAHPWVRDARIELADILRGQGKIQEAWEVLQQDPAVGTDDLPPNHPYAADLNRVAGLLSVAGGNPQRGRERLGSALRQTAALLSAEHWRYRRLLKEISSLNKNSSSGNSQEARS